MTVENLVESKNVYLKIGKRYILRNGIITEPIEKSKNGTSYRICASVKEPQFEKLSIMSWLENGKFLSSNIEHEHDIVRLYN